MLSMKQLLLKKPVIQKALHKSISVTEILINKYYKFK